MVSETLYVALVSCSSVLAVAVATWLWDEETDLTVRLFVAVVALHAVVGAVVVGELLAPTRSLAVGLYGVHAALGAAVPPVWFLFTVAYTGRRHRLRRPVLALVLGYWVVLAALQVTNPVHGLVWSDYAIASSPFPHVTGVSTTLSMVLSLPQALLYYGGLALLGAHLLFGSDARRTQTAALFVGFLPPAVVTSAWSAGVPVGPLNGTLVIGSTWLLAVAAWAVFRHQLFDIVPLARETVFDALDEMVVVVDRQRRLLDYNDAALATFPALENTDGEPVESALPELVAADEPDSGTDSAGTERPEADTPFAVSDGEKPARTGDPPDERAVESPSGESQFAESSFAASPVVGSPFLESFTRDDRRGPREYSVTATPLHVDEPLAGYALVIRDVTERRQRVRDLEQQTAQLERFASTLSHDLRNPLNVATGRVELARDGEDEHLATASDALDRMEQIIDDTLTLAREGQTIEARERVELSEVAESAWETTDTGDATLVVEPEAAVGLYADATRLRTVFENLFRNSVEHAATRTPTAQNAESDPATPLTRGSSSAVEGDPALTVRVGRCADGFYVEDDGPGVPADQRDAVFEYEFTTDDDGTGLGLAIVDAIASAHGWTVEMTAGTTGEGPEGSSDSAARGSDLDGSSESAARTGGRSAGARVEFRDVDFADATE